MNELAATEASNWPERGVSMIEDADNTFDYFGPAKKFTLECGHYCILTGSAIFNRSVIRCKRCAEANP